VSLDESYRLEPTQLAGFPQSFRTIISESVVGSVAAPSYETMGIGLDLKLPTRTYAGVQLERLSSEVHQTIGVFNYINVTPPIVPGSTREHLDYTEQGFSAYAVQLLGAEWAAGANYRFTHSELATRRPEIPTLFAGAQSEQRSELHQFTLFLLFNHASGFFARAESQFYAQHNGADLADLRDDSFLQVNLQVGYRFPRQHGEVSLGVLNLNDTDYRLHPLTPYAELPRERVFVARLLFNF
jgi:hypothetical protein